jgi:hypothetical protein
MTSKGDQIQGLSTEESLAVQDSSKTKSWQEVSQGLANMLVEKLNRSVLQANEAQNDKEKQEEELPSQNPCMPLEERVRRFQKRVSKNHEQVLKVLNTPD